MQRSRREFVSGGLGLAGLALAGCDRADSGIRIGFVVKQPEEQWFQDEWRFADRAAATHGFRIVRIGAPDGDKVLTAIDTLWAKYAQGFVICAPDPILGAAIRDRAAANGLKVMSVDDRLTGADGRPIATIPHVGISALAIGERAGADAAAEAKRRGWDLARTGVLRIAYDTLETARDRTMGARAAVIRAGLPPERIFDAPQRTTDTEGGFSAASPVLTRQAAMKHWVVLGMNDETVLGGVRAGEGMGLSANDLIGVGIGGSGSAVAEFGKAGLTGFWGSVLLSPRRHGYDTALAMYRWIADGVAPAPVTYTSGTMITRADFRQVLAREAT